MSEELEHIDSIFSEKLKNYREKPSENAWDKLAMGLDQKDQEQGKLNRNNKGKLGLLSITIISSKRLKLLIQIIPSILTKKKRKKLSK